MKRSDWFVPAALAAMSLVPAAAGMVRVNEIASNALTGSNARFIANPTPVLLHIIAVIPFSILGAFQFSNAFRKRFPKWHRIAGRVLVICGFVAAFTGLWMARFYPWPPNDGAGVYALRIVFGGLMVVSMLAGVDAIWRRDFAAHGDWMMRAYAIGMGAATQVFTHLPWFVLVGQPGPDARTVLMGMGWMINLAVAERIIRERTVATPHMVMAL
jgi:uncharacterized membrane protein